jgi:general stress protein 26
MKELKKSSFLIFISLLLFSANGFCQNSEHQKSSDSKILSVGREIMNSAASCALITVDQEGRPRVRMMDAFSPENDFTVWFGTNPKSRKVDQIRGNSKVTLYYQDSDGSGYVMIHGKAELVNDMKEKEERWKEDWEAFYENKKDAYILIKVTPGWMEVVSYAYGIVGDTITWEAPIVRLDSK